MASRKTGFSPALLQQVLDQLPHVKCYVVGLSGGADSVALLHALVAIQERLKCPVHALHVNHGLNPGADAWTQFCGGLCEQLEVPLRCEHIKVAPHPGESLEMAARRSRYEVFEATLDSNDGLCLGHHEDDQVETVLLNLFNGAGPAGLAGMPSVRQHNGGFHIFRPLLSFSRSSLQNYLREQGVHWEEDSSNRDLAMDRNYIRHAVMPVIRARWSGVDHCISRAARLQRAAQELSQHWISTLFAKVYEFQTASLSINGLAELGRAQCHAVLRHWLAEIGQPIILSEAQLNRLSADFLSAGSDRHPQFQQSNIRLIAYRGRIYKIVGAARSPVRECDIRLDERLVVDSLGLYFEPSLWQQLGHPKGRMQLNFRPTLQSCRSRTLKKRFQELAIPPWERDLIPVVECGGTLRALWGGFLLEGDA